MVSQRTKRKGLSSHESRLFAQSKFTKAISVQLSESARDQQKAVRIEKEPLCLVDTPTAIPLNFFLYPTTHSLKVGNMDRPPASRGTHKRLPSIEDDNWEEDDGAPDSKPPHRSRRYRDEDDSSSYVPSRYV